MARRCYFCGKKPSSGHSLSHSHRKTKRKWLPNLQKIKITEAGKIKRVYACTKCLKRGKIIKAV